MLIASLLVIFSLDFGLSIRTKRSLIRNKRDPCSFNKLFTMEKKKDNEYNFQVSPGLMDRIMIHNLDYDSVCNGNKLLDMETSNRIYVLNNQDTSREKRSAYGGGGQKRQRRSLGDQERHRSEAEASGVVRSRPVDKVRMIERLAVQIDQLDHHLHLAAQMLDTEKVQVDRQLFSIYKDRMKSLLKSKLKLTIQENKIILNSMEEIRLPNQFQR
jgi:hypothetical protein